MENFKMIILPVVVAGVILSSCKKQPSEPPIIFPQIIGKVVGIAPDGRVLPIPQSLVTLGDTKSDTTTQNGSFHWTSVEAGSYRLRVLSLLGKLLLDSTITLNRADTLLLRVPLSKEEADRFFTFPLAMGNEWVYEFSDQSYYWGTRYKTLGTKIAGTYTWRIVDSVRINDTILSYTTIGIRKMTVTEPNSLPYSIQDTVTGSNYLWHSVFGMAFNLNNTYRPNRNDYTGAEYFGLISTNIGRTNPSTSFCPQIDKDTMTVTGGCTNDTYIREGATFKFVHNVGITSISRQALSIYAPTDCQYTLKSYTLKK